MRLRHFSSGSILCCLNAHQRKLKQRCFSFLKYRPSQAVDYLSFSCFGSFAYLTGLILLNLREDFWLIGGKKETVNLRSEGKLIKMAVLFASGIYLQSQLLFPLGS